MVDKEKILAGRKVVGAYREAHCASSTELFAPLLDKLLFDLKELGFNSIDGFFEANKEAILEDRNRCARFEGECDYCKGRERGCLQSCYEKATELDGSSPSGRTKLVAGDRGDKGILATRRHWRDYYKSLGPLKKGMVYPILPGCSIKTRIIEEPKLDWDWE